MTADRLSGHIPRSISEKRKLKGVRPPSAEPRALPCGHPSTGGPVAATASRRWYDCSAGCGLQTVAT